MEEQNIKAFADATQFVPLDQEPDYYPYLNRGDGVDVEKFRNDGTFRVRYIPALQGEYVKKGLVKPFGIMVTIHTGHDGTKIAALDDGFTKGFSNSVYSMLPSRKAKDDMYKAAFLELDPNYYTMVKYVSYGLVQKFSTETGQWDEAQLCVILTAPSRLAAEIDAHAYDEVNGTSIPLIDPNTPVFAKFRKTGTGYDTKFTKISLNQVTDDMLQSDPSLMSLVNVDFKAIIAKMKPLEELLVPTSGQIIGEQLKSRLKLTQYAAALGLTGNTPATPTATASPLSINAIKPEVAPLVPPTVPPAVPPVINNVQVPPIESFKGDTDFPSMPNVTKPGTVSVPGVTPNGTQGFNDDINF